MILPALLCAAFAAAGDDVPWRGDLAQAEREAAATGRPLLLVFR